MARDLDGYTTADCNGKDQRRTTWYPYGFELTRKAAAYPCACPCRIAHPNYLADSCDQEARVTVAEVAVGSVGMGTHVLPLCGVCAAAQLHDRWRDAEADAAAWKYAESAPVVVAVLVAIAAVVIGSWAVAGVAGGLCLSVFVFALVHEQALKKRRGR